MLSYNLVTALLTQVLSFLLEHRPPALTLKLFFFFKNQVCWFIYRFRKKLKFLPLIFSQRSVWLSFEIVMRKKEMSGSLPFLCRPLIRATTHVWLTSHNITMRRITGSDQVVKTPGTGYGFQHQWHPLWMLMSPCETFPSDPQAVMQLFSPCFQKTNAQRAFSSRLTRWYQASLVLRIK